MRPRGEPAVDWWKAANFMTKAAEGMAVLFRKQSYLIERFISSRLLFTEGGLNFEAHAMLRCIAVSHFKYFIPINRPWANMSTPIFFIWSIQPKTVLHDIAGIITTITNFFFSRGVGRERSWCKSKSSVIVWNIYPLLQTIGGWDRECRVTCDLSTPLFNVELIDIIGRNNLTMPGLSIWPTCVFCAPA